MGKMVKAVKNQSNRKVENFMSGVSYEVNPLLTLKLVTASSIFGEPQYYRDGEFEDRKIKDGTHHISQLLKEDILLKEAEGLKTSELMEKVIDKALDFDFQGTLEWAGILRTNYYMRLNPQIIMVRAAMHKNRVNFTKQNPNIFPTISQVIMQRADEPSIQLTYWLYKNNSKNKLPSLLKRCWARRLSKATRYELYKYKNKGLGIIDTVRICHANSRDIDELLTTGSLKLKESNRTWEALRSEGKSWAEIIKTTKLLHMALLRNLRGIFTESNDKELFDMVKGQLKAGVLEGKQFPFRYYSAMRAVKSSKCNFKALLCDVLEECMDISAENLPKLKGRTMCLSDNSGSAWGTFPSEYGTAAIAEIDNLSSVTAAYNSEEGYVGKFGDALKIYPVMKKNGILSQAEAISKTRYQDIGGSTENGIWIFFDQAIQKKEHWDHIFIYSDQQAGHGGLYGIDPGKYKNYSINKYIDVYKMIQDYRKKVNPHVNVYSIQTAGYHNILVPEMCYRTAILYGWTGRELIYADAMNQIWNEAGKASTLARFPATGR